MSRPPPVELSFAAGSEHRTGWASPALSTDEKTEAQGGREGGHKRLCGEQWQGRDQGSRSRALPTSQDRPQRRRGFLEPSGKVTLVAGPGPRREALGSLDGLYRVGTGL